jgi:DNA-binding phage protein
MDCEAMTLTDVAGLITMLLARHGNMTELARHLGIDPETIRRTTQRGKPPSDALLVALGLERVITYRRWRVPSRVEP